MSSVLPPTCRRCREPLCVPSQAPTSRSFLTAHEKPHACGRTRSRGRSIHRASGRTPGKPVNLVPLVGPVLEDGPIVCKPCLKVVFDTSSKGLRESRRNGIQRRMGFPDPMYNDPRTAPRREDPVCNRMRAEM
jgi:hypothetical protein